MLTNLQNLTVFSKSDFFLSSLKSFGIIEQGHFEYKGKAPDGTRLRGGYFINFRKLTTAQEIELTPLYWNALEEFFGLEKLKNSIIVGVAFGSLSLPKTIQVLGYEKYGIEYAYTEKREGVLGLWGEQAEKCKGKHVIFLEDVFNNGTSLRELVTDIEDKKDILGVLGYSLVYGVHRGHRFSDIPAGEIYALGVVYAPACHADDLPEQVKMLPMKPYKK